MNYTSLVLSGGGLRASCMLGILENLGRDIDLTNIINFAGTSSGAVVCFLLIIGFNPSEIIANICSFQLLNKLKEQLQYYNLIKIQNGGIISFSIITDFLIFCMKQKNISENITFEELHSIFNKNYTVVSVNCTHKRVEYFSHTSTPQLEILKSLQMSCSVPFIFEVCEYNNSVYIDGGIKDNFPIDILFPHCGAGNKLLGITMKEKIDNYIPTKFVLHLISRSPDSWKPLNKSVVLLFKYINSLFENKYQKNINIDSKSTVICYDANIFPFNFGIDISILIDLFMEGYNWINPLKKQFIKDKID